jgi:hypothetical protein
MASSLQLQLRLGQDDDVVDSSARVVSAAAVVVVSGAAVVVGAAAVVVGQSGCSLNERKPVG